MSKQWKRKKSESEKWLTLTSDPEKVNPRVWEADHGAVRRLLRVEVVPLAGAEIGDDGGGEEEEVVDAWARRFGEILQRGFGELESFLPSLSDTDCIFLFFFSEELIQARFTQTNLFRNEDEEWPEAG